MSDWIDFARAHERAGDAKYLLGKFLSRNRVEIAARRSDRPSEPPDRVETLLAEADRVEILDGGIMRVHVRRGGWLDEILLTEVRVNWPRLAAELEAAGYRAQGGRKETKVEAVRRFIDREYPDGIPAGVSQKMIARGFEKAHNTKADLRTIRRALGGK